jgi:C-terminal processing protease CtpA/Prc
MPTCRAILRRVSHTATLFAACSLLACGGGSNSEAFKSVDALTALTTAPLSTRQALYAHMQDRYLWYNDIPPLDLTDPQYQNLGNLLEDLRKIPEDRFSGFADAALQQQRIEQGVSGSFGLRFTLRETNEPGIDVRIASVEDESSVAAAGLQRGDRVIAAQGVDIDELGYDGFRDLFQEPGLGVQRNLTVRHPDGQQRTVTIERTEHALSPVRKANVFTSPTSGRRTGYVLIEEFIRLTSTQLESFRDNYASAGLDDLILDLRYNGGGLVSASRDLASSVYGQAPADSVYTTLQRNDKYSAEDFTFSFINFDNAFTTLSRVFILMTGSTCSASEEVINGLKPFMEVITIGAESCGKPYASRGYELVPDVVDVHILESRSVNADGDGDFFNGFSPVCEADDDPVLPFSDPQESLISVALHYADYGECPAPIAVASDRIRSISAVRQTMPALPSAGAIYDTD